VQRPQVVVAVAAERGVDAEVGEDAVVAGVAGVARSGDGRCDCDCREHA